MPFMCSEIICNKIRGVVEQCPKCIEGVELPGSYCDACAIENLGVGTRKGRKAASNSCPFQGLNRSLGITMATVTMPY